MRSAQQKKKSPPVEAAVGCSPQKLTPESASPSSPPILPPWRQWLSHDDMHLVRKHVTYSHHKLYLGSTCHLPVPECDKMSQKLVSYAIEEGGWAMQ